jgi:hypothetical protein
MSYRHNRALAGEETCSVATTSYLANCVPHFPNEPLGVALDLVQSVIQNQNGAIEAH